MGCVNARATWALLSTSVQTVSHKYAMGVRGRIWHPRVTVGDRSGHDVMRPVGVSHSYGLESMLSRHPRPKS